MTAKAKKLAIVGAIFFVLAISVVGLAAVKVVAWARDLPNRIVVDGDAIANAFGQAVIDSYHVAFRDGDTATQLQILEEQFAPLARKDQEGADWIRKEYGDEIKSLVASDDEDVATAALALMVILEADAGSETDASLETGAKD